MKKFLQATNLTQPYVLHYSLIWLMVLLVGGTVAQKYMGLYQAQHQFFYSFIIWLGPIPVPGGFSVLALITANLFAKLVFDSPWKWSNSGIIIAHLGVLLLLLGGFLTAVNSKEGEMVIYEKASSDYFSDYHLRELVVTDSETSEVIASFSGNQLKEGKIFTVPGLPVQIEIVKACRNCDVFPRKTLPSAPLFKELRGRLKDLDLECLPPEKEEEKNRFGVIFRMSGTGTEKDGLHFTVDFISVSPNFLVRDKNINVTLRRKRTELPFKIELVDFEKKFYPGTDIPAKYKSRIIVKDGISQWPSLVEMNDPLRYKGYTFYQSSFLDDGETEATVFAVVKNAGRLFPYISSIVIALGLLTHIVLNVPRLIGRKI